MRRSVAFLAITLILGLVPSADAVTPKAGATCKKLGAKQSFNNREFTCIKKGNKRVWNKGLIIRTSPSATPTPTASASSTPTSTPTPTPTPTPTGTPTVTPTPVPTPTQTVREFTAADVAARNNRANCWSIINGNVYDLTKWIEQHPGGDDKILRICGVDGTSRFTGQHGGSSSVAAELKNYLIGVLRKS